jgi:hypothetical protein
MLRKKLKKKEIVVLIMKRKQDILLIKTMFMNNQDGYQMKSIK